VDSTETTFDRLDVDQAGATGVALFASRRARVEVKTTPDHFRHVLDRSRRSAMKRLGTTAQRLAVLAMGLGFTFAVTAMAADAEAAKALARQNNCFKCHGTDKDKDGPSLKSIAAKYKGNADAESKLTTHVTSGEMAKFPDGHSEAHKKVEPNDPAQIKNLVDWILSL
jgi:cytochrome c